MKFYSALILLIVMMVAPVVAVHAQAAETLWIQANAAAYRTGEIVVVTIHANSAAPIQGFTTQIRYDPACLQPIDSVSAVPGMNGLALPQTSGLVDVSYASTVPQTASGVLAEARFKTLKGCQANLALESAALVARNESGFAVPITGINIDRNAVALNIDSAMGSSQPMVPGAPALSLAPTIFPKAKPAPGWGVALTALLAVILIISIVILYKLARPFEV